MHPEFAPVAFIAAASVLLPLPSHWRARNIATLSIISWLFVLNLIYGIDAVIWAGNADIVVPVWCDITTKLIVGANIALPAACLCVCVHLERVASTRVASVTTADRRRRNLFEVSMCVLLPIVYMGLHFIVQGHRFDIIEDYGCRPTTYYSIPSILLVWVPPIILSVACLIFAGLALRHFVIRRLTFAGHLATHSALTPSRFFRLMSMAVVEMFWSLGVTIYVMWFNSIAVPIRPWTTWDKVHSDWLRIDPWLASFTPKFIMDSFYVLWWLVPASTFIFVVFFAFGADSMEMYKKFGMWIWTRVFRLPTPKKSKLSLPMFRITDKEKNQGLSLPTLIKPGFTNSIATSTQDSSTYPEPPTPKKLQGEYDNERRYQSKSLSECYTYSEHDSDLDTVYSPPPPFKDAIHGSFKAQYDDTPTTPTSIYTESSATYAPSTSTSPPRRGATTNAGIPIEERIADPAELSRAVGPNSPLYPPSTWPRAI
ncbi:putative fungal pheromone ste3-type [Moniliophthora roreri MCA 2997]|uniref:Fungal pheromone ste3-type n=2 Tax=Moniliophthora roreri TaxID=221103 RepID=V2WXA8_MONRO|nr:STE3-like pheromone receptor STE3_Mr1.2 [Moniliophthora roreri]ESK91513.1 putative fungal pheromone ste3-type [Moniliophthora roreri MCA 2997]